MDMDSALRAFAWRWLRRLLVSAACVAALLGAAVYSSWEPDRQISELAARWALAPSQFIEVDGMQVHIRDQGPRDDPNPIILIHGLAASLHTWQDWTAGLQAKHRVISIDLPGFGLTGPSVEGDYQLSAYVRFMLRLMDTLELKSAVLGGNGLGAEIAWQTAATAPRRVSALVLVGADGYEVSPLSVPLALRLCAIPAMDWFARRILPRWLVAYSVRNVYGDSKRVTPALVDRYFELALRVGNRGALRQRFVQTDAGANAELIKRLRLPTLILWGGKDRMVPPDHAQRFARDIAGSQVVIFDDLGHVPQEEAPQRALKPVQAFLQTLAPTP